MRCQKTIAETIKESGRVGDAKMRPTNSVSLLKMKSGRRSRWTARVGIRSIGRSILISFCSIMPPFVLTIALPARLRSRSNQVCHSLEGLVVSAPPACRQIRIDEIICVIQGSTRSRGPGDNSIIHKESRGEEEQLTLPRKFPHPLL